MKYDKDLKEKVLSEYANSSIKRKDLAEKYNIPIETLKGWLKKEHINHLYNSHSVIIQSDYRKMTKEDLQIEIIKKDFEIAKLKKKYPWLNDTEDTELDGRCK